MAEGYKTGGRKRGSLNKTTALAKDAIAKAAHDLGGAERLVAWAKEDVQNERVLLGHDVSQAIAAAGHGRPERASPSHRAAVLGRGKGVAFGPRATPGIELSIPADVHKT